MHSGPLYQLEQQLHYQRHLARLDEIAKQRTKKVHSHSFNSDLRRRNRSLKAHAFQQHQSSISHQNDRVVANILKIARRKSQPFFMADSPPKVANYQNKARKEKQRQIERSNLALAERILSKQSDFDPQKQQKQIAEYQNLKQQIRHNKRVGIPMLGRGSGSRIRLPASSTVEMY